MIMMRFGSGTYNVRDSEVLRDDGKTIQRTVICTVNFLDGTQQDFELERHARGQELLDRVFEHLELVEKDYFGLQFADLDGETDRMCWLDPLKSIRKQMQCPPFVLHFRVKFYVSDPSKLQEEYTRYHFYLQIRRDVLDERLVCPESSAALLASYSAQSEFGDYCAEEHGDSYLDGFQCVPNQTTSFIKKVIELHKLHRGQTPADAEYSFLDHAKRLDTYGVDLYPAKDCNLADVQLGVASYGLAVFQRSFKINTFLWSRILKVTFKRKQFNLHLKSDEDMGGTVLTFLLSSTRASKMLWKSCVEHHTFFRLITPPLPVSKGLFSFGSHYRYSGRTEYQTLEEMKRKARIERTFNRVGSRMSFTHSSYTPSLMIGSRSSFRCEKLTRRQRSGPSLNSTAIYEEGRSGHESLSVASSPGKYALNRKLYRMSQQSETVFVAAAAAAATSPNGFCRSLHGWGCRATSDSSVLCSYAAAGASTRGYSLAPLPLSFSSTASSTRALALTSQSSSCEASHSSCSMFDATDSGAVKRRPPTIETTFGTEMTSTVVVDNDQPIEDSYEVLPSFSEAPRVRPSITAKTPPSSSKVIAVSGEYSLVSSSVGCRMQNGYCATGSSPASSNLLYHQMCGTSSVAQPSVPSSSSSVASASTLTTGQWRLSTKHLSAASSVLTNGCVADGVVCSESQGDESLVTIRMTADAQGRFGFNVKGGIDDKYPISVSRVVPGSPADTCIPRLNEGDQILMINQVDVSHFTHDQTVRFIRSCREVAGGELVVVARPNAYLGEEIEEPDFQLIPQAPRVADCVPRSDILHQSLLLLRDSLASGAAIVQFEKLYRRKPGMAMKAARESQNTSKNRYRDVSPYDDTRIIIRNGRDGDYINASYINMEIPGSGIVNRYIAGQGPLPQTTADFWQAVWEQLCATIVMLTATTERGRAKCHQYWPNLYETQEFGSIRVTCVKESETKVGSVREISVIHKETGEERLVTHMQYVTWPDHGVPEDSRDIIDFIVQVRHFRAGMVEPLFVHCSAGIGRTGVLILVETAMCLIEANEPVYPLDIVRTMRDQRAMLIQTSGQYKFACETILRIYNDCIVKPSAEYQR